MSFSFLAGHKRFKYLLLLGSWSVLGIALWAIYYSQQPISAALVFPDQVYIDNVLMNGQTPQGALRLLMSQQTAESVASESAQYTLVAAEHQLASSSAELGIQKNYQQVVDQAFQESTALPTNFLTNLLTFGQPKPAKYYQTTWQFNQTAVQNWIELLKQEVDQPGQAPHATLARSGVSSSLTIDPGTAGQELNVDQTIANFAQDLAQNLATTSASVASTSATLTPEEVTSATARAQKFVGKQVVFQKEGLDQILHDQQLVKLLNFPEGFKNDQITQLLTDWQKKLDTQPQNAVFTYDPQTLKVTTFTPPRNGVMLNVEQTRQDLLQALETIEKNEPPEQAGQTAQKTFTYQLVFAETPPKITLADTNNLGIKERIGFGESEYDHSIPGRIHNVSLTAERINNTIVKPGEEFSFNKALGEVSAATGFAPAYIIKSGRTELGDGGGVCQVSTTVFRALLNAGLPITKRIAHSYRVSYYELNAKPGIDATVYAGNIDLRFKNDTGHAVLIHTETFPKSLYMFVEIYGTSDGRTTAIVNHKTWDYTPAPPTVYQDDPTLRRGVLKQIDFAAAGIKASFTNVVKDKSSKVIREDTYNSNYKPWRAVFLRGTG